MNYRPNLDEPGQEVTGSALRQRLLAAAPMTEHRLDLAGVATATLAAGDGPPVVLLHGQGGFAAMWLPVADGLLPDCRVIAPDLPGLGDSTAPAGPPGSEQVLAWLAALIEQTCPTPPVLVGHSLGGSIAARFAADHSDRLAGLVLVDAGGLAGRVRPAPGVLLALIRSRVRPTEPNLRRLFRRLTADLDRPREVLGERWGSFLAYAVDRAGTASVQRANDRLLRKLGMPGIAPEALVQIRTATRLVWGRRDRVMPVRGAERASTRYGWPLRVAENAGHLPHLERPETVIQVIRELRAPRIAQTS